MAHKPHHTNTHTQKQRHGLHHKHTKLFKKVYWPYLPIALVLVFSFLITWIQPRNNQDVLAYANSMSSLDLLQTTNAQRSAYDVNPLKLNDELTKAAQAKANDMANRDYWSHNTPDGEEPWIFIDETAYEYTRAGENLAYGFRNSRHTIAGWMNSTSHRQNMLDNSYQDVGFGYVNTESFRGNGPQTIVVAMYATPLELASENQQDTSDSPLLPATSGTGISSDKPIVEPAVKQVALVETLTNGRIPWIFFAVGLLSGIVTTFMLIRHGLKLHKLIKDSENFVLHHPILDTAVMLILVVTVILSQGQGFIR
ncbi:MAG: CAP domain-containing protein [Candidatus Saccharibacteria bacterium]|nr:CAP domain-containing protein [Candidatus Saccharibacteria bacterium]